MAKHLRKSGGIDGIERTVRTERRQEFINLAKATLKTRSLGEFEVPGARPKAARWVPLIGQLHPSGTVTVHEVFGDKRAAAERLLEIRGREIKKERLSSR